MGIKEYLNRKENDMGIKKYLNRNCYWGHDWTLWGDPFDRGWKKYDDDAVYTRSYQRRTCNKCGKIAEQQVGLRS